MNNQEPITGTFSLGEFNPKKEELLLKGNQYKNLTISGIDDKDGYELVHKARMDLVRTRTDIEKKGKELRQPHTEFNKKVKEIEDELISLIEPIEKDLKEKQQSIDNEKERIKEEKEQKKREQLQVRINMLTSINVSDINIIAIQEMSDEEFKTFYDIQNQNFLVLEEERKYNEDVKYKILTCNLLDGLEEFINDGVLNDITLPFYNKRKQELEFEEQQKDLRKQQEILNKQLEEQRKESNIKIKISNLNSLDELEKYQLEIGDDDKFTFLFNTRKDQLVFEKDRRDFKEQQEQSKQKAEQEEGDKQNFLLQDRLDNERKIKEEQEKKIEDEKQKKRTEYINWVKSLGYKDEDKHLYKHEVIGNKRELWKKLGEITL